MAEKSISLHGVFARLMEQGLLDESAVGRISEHLSREQAAPATPWYIKLLIAFGAWVAAGFFLGFLVAAGFAYSLVFGFETWQLLMWGAVFIIVGTVLRRQTEHVFTSLLALALSAAGHVMALVGVGQLFGELWAAALAAVFLCAVLYPLFRDSMHRFASTLLATGMITAWLIDADLEHGLHLLLLLEVVGAGYLFTSRRTPASLRPMAYALAVSLLGTLAIILMPEVEVETPWWPSSAILAVAMVWLYGRLAGGARQLRREPMVVAICVTLLLGTVSTPGVLAAVWLLVLGYALGDRILLGLGLAFLPVFIVMYYYDLDVSLLTKSWVLAASGGILLCARWYLSTRPWAREDV